MAILNKSNKIYKLGLDIGNSGIKMAGRISETEFKLDNIKALATNDATDSSYVVHLDGDDREIYFGVGDPLTTQDKTKRPYLKQIILLALANIYGDVTDCESVKVGIGLPLKDFKNEHKRKSYEEELSRITQVSGRVNNKYYLFNVSINVYAEGFSAFYYLMPNLGKDYRWLICDHGYRSTDVVGVSYDSNKQKWRVDDYTSLNKGLLEMYQEIARQFSFVTHEEPYLAQDIEYYMRERIKLMTSNPDYPEVDLNDFSYGAIGAVSQIYNDLALKFTDINARKILLLGGGAELVNQLLEKTNKQFEEDFNKRLYGNAIGFYLQLR